MVGETISILGTEYEFVVDDLNNPELATNDGFCLIYDKKIVVRGRDYMSGLTEKSRQYRMDHVIRHELIHAVAQESGASYGNNEELVDWIAHIIPIVNKAFEDIGQKGVV